MHERGRIDHRFVGPQAEQQFGLGDDLIADVRRRLGPGQRRAPAAQRHLEPQLIARHDLTPEPRPVDAAQVRPFGGPGVAVALKQQDRRHLRPRLQHEDRGQQRRAWEMSLEELLVDRDVLDRDDPPPGLVLRDGVNEQRRIAVAEAVEEDGDVGAHGRD
jgi:hypothetical protein